MKQIILNGILLDEQSEFSLNDLCCVCSSSAEWIIELVEEGALEPIYREKKPLQPLASQQTKWRFSADDLQRARTAMRLQRDLNLNLAGIAMVLDLLENIETLETRLRRFEIAGGQ